MLSLVEASAGRAARDVTRREILRIGSLHLAGLTLPALLRAQASAATTGGGSFGKAKNVIFLWLQGGPPQHETFDPKPDAPAEIRGPFKPISTNVPGIQIGELLPRTARIADKLAIVRSLATDDNNHDVSGYWILTGVKYPFPSARQIKPTDWPYFGSVLKRIMPSPTMPALTSVWIPDLMRLNDNVQPAGQTAGFLGPTWEPERFVGDPAQADYKIEGLALPGDIPAMRFDRRRDLLAQMESHFASLERGGMVHDHDKIAQNAFGLLTSGHARQAFAIDREPEKLRDRYGRHTWGQSVLLARRLIEAGVRLVHVNWPREPGDNAVDNPMWDTHAQNADRLQDTLCPQFDVTFTTLIEDLESRGLLSETLVVAIGEFGRTPKINSKGGRDHWGNVFSFVMAGAGISGAQVFGSSDKTGGYPASDPLRPHDLLATIVHLLGIPPHAMFPDRSGRPLPVTVGEPIHKLLGTQPATIARTESTGDIALVPPFDPNPLVDVGFEAPQSIQAVDLTTRNRGWRAMPLAESASDDRLSVRLVEAPQPVSRGGKQHALIGFGLGSGSVKIPAGGRATLVQQVRAPQAGQYTFSVHAAGGGNSAEFYRDVFLKNFECRLVIFGYTDLAKDPSKVREFASLAFQPPFGPDAAPVYERFQVARILRSQDGGAFELSMGIGVAIVVQKTSPGTLDLAGPSRRAFIRLDDVQLEFNARPRNDDVRV
jgi:hypothetical protein